MKKIFLLLIICPILVFSQDSIRVLDNIDFENEDVYLMFLYQRFHKLDDTTYKVQGSTNKFLVIDKDQLLKLQDEWIGYRDPDMKVYECGYDYKMYIVNKDSIIAGGGLNIDCGQMIFWTGQRRSCNFKGNPFQDLKMDAEVYSEYFSTDTITEARLLFKTVKDAKYIYCPYIEYKNEIAFDGRATMQIEIDKGMEYSYKDAKQELEDRYGKGCFYLSYRDKIYCNESTYQLIYSEKDSFENFTLNFNDEGWYAWFQFEDSFGVRVYSHEKEALDKLK